MATPSVRTYDRPGVRLAWAAFAIGSAYALVSASWGLGSTWALDTVGGALESEGRAGNPVLLAVVWLSVLLKLIAAVLGLAVTLPLARGWVSAAKQAAMARLVVIGAWTAAVVLTAYGGLLTLGGILVQADVIHASADADHRALAFHAYLWDPWFLVWGLLLGAALLRSAASRRTAGPARREQS